MDIFHLVLITASLAALAAALILAAFTYLHSARHEHYECPGCAFPFKPGPGAFLASTFWVAGRVFTCPRCGRRGYMLPVPDRKAVGH